MGTLHKIQHRELNHNVVRSGKPFTFTSQNLIKSFDWFFEFSESHPEKYLLNRFKYTIEMKELHKRDDLYHETKTQLEYFKNIFPENIISLIVFASPTSYSTNYGKHKDRMDVILHQGKGEIEIEIEDYQEVTLKNDDTYLWIPRGITHLIKPKGCRLTHSFGVEGGDPKELY